MAGWARRHPVRLGDVSVTLLTVRLAERFVEVRVMGLAAEMTYYALLSIFPLTAALGASLGFLERLIGSEDVAGREHDHSHAEHHLQRGGYG